MYYAIALFIITVIIMARLSYRALSRRAANKVALQRYNRTITDHNDDLDWS